MSFFSSNKTPKAPLALMVDDDPFITKVIGLVLKKFGVESVAVTNSRDFLQKLKEIKPDFCLIDLNLEAPGLGFTVIQAVRNVQGNKPVLIVMSGLTDSKSIAHALEIGANDFITKPIDREVLGSKISRYVMTPQLEEADRKLLPVPDGGASATLEIALHIEEVDEYGIKVSSPHLLAKGMTLPLEGTWIHEFTGRSKPLQLSVISTSIDPERGHCVAVTEFDVNDNELMEAVRRWLSVNAKPQEAKGKVA